MDAIRQGTRAGAVFVLCLGLLWPVGAQAVDDADIAAAEQQVTELQQSAAAAAEQANQATLEWQKAQQAVADKEAELSETQQSLLDYKNRLNQVVSLVYRSGSVDPTLLMLSVDEPSSFMSSLATIELIAAQQNLALQQTEVAEQQLRRDEEALRKAERKAERAADRVLEYKADIDARLQDSLAVLSQLQEQQRLELEAELARQRQQQQQEADDAQEVVETLPRSTTKPVIEFALEQVGKDYKQGGTGPDTYDASGLTKAAWAQADVRLPHSVQAQFDATQRVDVTLLAPGDLVFLRGPGEHVGIYTGDGYFVHASDPRNGVKYEKLFVNEFMSEFAGAGRPRV